MLKILARLFRRQPPEISPAQSRDAAAIARLHAASFHRGWGEEEFASLLLERHVIAHRAMSGGRLAGFILSRLAADEAEILSVAVAASGRGRGVARELLDRHLRRLAGLGIKSVFLEVDPGNVPACRLYKRAGFHQVGHRPGYYPPAEGAATSALVLRRDLT
jgi:ribosomal-protein-alanine N-acetyltransferase